MKITLLKLISAASITATFSLLGSLPASAQTTEIGSHSSTTPFSLVSQAQSGRFKSQGISGNGNLKTQYRLHRVTAESLVQAGVDAHLIPAETLQNSDYINAVDSQMQHRINN